MMERGSIFAPDDAFESRLINDPAELSEIVSALKRLGLKIVLTSGSYDLPHKGHWRYLREARKLGDFLVVGVDSDDKVRASKGEFRPVLPALDRAEMVAHTRYADIVTIKPRVEEKWALIKTVRPDILVISTRTKYDDAAKARLGEFCGQVVMLESQAETSTSANVRRLQLETLVPHLMQIRDLADEMIQKAQTPAEREEG